MKHVNSGRESTATTFHIVGTFITEGIFRNGQNYRLQQPGHCAEVLRCPTKDNKEIFIGVIFCPVK